MIKSSIIAIVILLAALLFTCTDSAEMSEGKRLVSLPTWQEMKLKFR